MSHCRRGGLLAVMIVTLGLWSWPAVTSARGTRQRTGPPVLSTKFRAYGTAAELLSDGRFAFAAPANANEPGVLFDDRQRRQIKVAQDGCGVAGTEIFGGVLAFDCWRARQSAPQLYVISSRRRRTVALDPSITDPCGLDSECENITAVANAGSDWLQFSESACPGDEHCTFWNEFENIHTGAVEPDPAVEGGHEIADLDSPELAQPICSPLTIPEGFNIFTAPGPGELTFQGRFALATSPTPKGGSQTYLEECGTRLHQLIESTGPGAQTEPVASSPHAIVWQQTPAELTLEFLPSRRRFAIHLPNTVGPIVTELALTDNHLYATGRADTLWRAPSPPVHPRHDPHSSRKPDAWAPAQPDPRDAPAPEQLRDQRLIGKRLSGLRVDRSRRKAS